MTALQPSQTDLTALPAADLASSNAASAPQLEEQVLRYERAFGQSFFLYDTASDTTFRSNGDCLAVDVHARLGVCDQAARRSRAEVIEDFAPLLSIAIPLLEGDEASTVVAVGVFVTSSVQSAAEIEAAAQELGVNPERAFRWARDREVWNPRGVVELAKSLLSLATQRVRQHQQQKQLSEVSAHLLSTFEELSMLHRLTEHLSIASTESELAGLAVEWLLEVAPAEAIAVVRSVSTDGLTPEQVCGAAEVVCAGECPLDVEVFPELLDRLGPQAVNKCLVLGEDFTGSGAWSFPSVRQLVSVPIRSGDRTLGWVLALNHTAPIPEEAEFTAVEGSLLSSVAAILGVHAGNCALYGEQKDFFSAMVRALSSAIDAKDPYTCGHSDRVARLSVCLARELGCDSKELNTIYLGGLLHDIGKIGIEDKVLRKAGKLTQKEFDHIKTHPELGHRILQGVRQMEKVLPIVLHHHEAWDGRGYPHGLAGEACPRLARIVAVADAIDAMSSDRPYRAGMADDQLDRILHEGAGKQWDAEVIDAVFRTREQIREIGRSDREPLALDVREWNL